MQNEPVEVTIKVTEVIERLGISYLIVGSLASTLYGKARTTQDSDIIAEIRLAHLQSSYYRKPGCSMFHPFRTRFINLT